jgi:hypothetical protein
VINTPALNLVPVKKVVLGVTDAKNLISMNLCRITIFNLEETSRRDCNKHIVFVLELVVV